jgi:hypothetical protein
VEAGRINSVSDLATRPTGLKRYFDSWWSQVSGSTGDGAVKYLLRYLLVALGPIDRDDLVDISQSDELDGMSFERALEKVRRVVVGNNEVGYALSQRRFRDYLTRELIKEEELRPHLDQLLQYCASHRGKPSRYVLQYFGQHLAQSGSWSELCGLVKLRTWYASHLSFDPTGGSFLRDVELAAGASAEANAVAVQQEERCPAIAEGVHAALVIASLHTRARSVGSKLLAALLDAGLLTPSRLLSMAQNNPNDASKARIIATLAPHSAALIGEALELARSITEKDAKCSALLALRQAVVADRGSQLVLEAWDLAKTVEDPASRATCLAAVASELPEPERSQALAQGFEAASEVEQHDERADAGIALLSAAPESSSDEVVDRALTAAVAIDDPSKRTQRISALAAAAPKRRAAELAHAAVSAARQIVDLSERIEKINCLLGVLDSSERAPVENEVLATIGGLVASQKVRAVADFIATDPTVSGASKLLDEALAIVRDLPESGEQYELFGKLAAAATPDRADLILEEAIRSVEALADAEHKVWGLTALAQNLTGDLRRRALGKGLNAARQIADLNRRAVWLFSLAPQLDGVSRQAALQEAFAWPGGFAAVAGKLDDGLESTLLMLTLADRLLGPPRALAIQDALTFAKEIDDNLNRATALVAVIPYLDNTERERVIEEAFAAALAVEEDVHKADILAALTPWMQGERREGAIEYGVSAALRIDEEAVASTTFTLLADGEDAAQKGPWTFHARARPLFRLAAAASGAQQERLTKQARDALFNLEQRRQALVLKVVAEALPEAAVCDLLGDIRSTQSAEWRRQVLVALLDRWEEITSPEEALARAKSMGKGWLPVPQVEVQPGRSSQVQRLAAEEDAADSKEVSVRHGHAEYYVTAAFRLTENGMEDGLTVRPAEGEKWPSDAAEHEITANVRSQAIEECLSRMSRDEVDRTLNDAEAWCTDTWQQAKVALISRLLNLECLPAALEAVKANWGNEPPPQMLAALVPHLQTLDGEALLPRALHLARQRETSAERAALLAMLAVYIDGPTKPMVCNEVLRETCAALADGSWQDGFALKPDQISSASRSALHTAWLAVLGQKPRFREKTLTLLAAFWPIAEALGGENVTGDGARALKDIVCWWP